MDVRALFVTYIKGQQRERERETATETDPATTTAIETATHIQTTYFATTQYIHPQTQALSKSQQQTSTIS